MIVIYPKNAITMKDIDSLTYLTFASMSINMNQYNNECSNTFLLLNIAGREIYRSVFDLEYQPMFTLDNIDFSTIDRINRFKLDDINKLTYDFNTNSIVASDYIIGYSVLTNSAYRLENVNSYTDFTRHSIPCDAFVELYNKAENISSPTKVMLSPYVTSYIEEFIVDNSKVSIELVDYNIIDILTSMPQLRISGIGIDNSPIQEIVDITNGYGIETKNEYSKILSVMSIGISDTISIILYPYIVKRYGNLKYKYIDKEDPLTEYDSVYYLSKEEKALKVSTLNGSNIYPPRFDFVESVDLNIPDSFVVDEFTFDDQNGLLYTICIDTDTDTKFFLAFPIYIPFSFENISLLENTKEQSIKITYVRDTINKMYSFEIFPTSNAYGFDSLDITIRHSYKRAKGVWAQNKSYLIGDLVLFNAQEYICTIGHISSTIFDINKFTSATKKVTSNFLIELISSGIESNRFNISFDDLFIHDTESIVEFTTNGNKVCVQQILCQYHKLDPCIIKELQKLLSTFVIDKNAAYDETIIYPIENEDSRLILNKIEKYRYTLPIGISMYDTYRIYKSSSTGKININGYPIVHVYNTFFIDQATKTLITSDTITNIFNQDEKDIEVFDKFIVSTYDKDGVPMIISDSFNRLFINKRGNIYAN
jgi:hypothetical protein